ncbi:MAG TPA: HAD family hydrolase [Candidatus Dojkabacteria bacterium]|nr:HAD family hydrolase [Candidatus Dojkabacteria bacterium]
MKKQTIALFDFDGTLIKKDSFIDFIIFSKGLGNFIKGVISNFFDLFLYALNLKSGDQVKEKLFSYFFAKTSYKKFKDVCTKYSLEKIPKIINPQIFKKFLEHNRNGDTLILASASIKDWIYPWAKKVGFNKIIVTEVALSGSDLSGKFATPNCNNAEKLRRFLKEFPERNYYLLYVYGNLNGDKELLEIADFKTII